MIDYRQLQALASVHANGSFEKAANQLSITQSAISQRVKLLEERIGQALLIRTTPITPTATGYRLIQHYQQVMLLEHDLQEDLTPYHVTSDPKPIAIGVNADSIATWFFDAIGQLIDSYKLILELKVDDQENTHELLRTGEVAACVTSCQKPVQGCHSIRLGTMRYRMLAAPSLQRSFAIHQDWQQLPIVEFNRKDQLQTQYLEQYYNTAPNHNLTHRIPSSESFVDYIRRGFAAGMVPDEQSADLLGSGALVDLAPGHHLDVPLYWHVWSLKSSLMKTLTDTIVIHTQSTLYNDIT